VPRVFASVMYRNASSTVWPAYWLRSNDSLFQPPLSPLKPGQLLLSLTSAPGSRSQVVSALDRLWYVLPPSFETCTKNESKPGSVSYFVSNVSVGFAAGTATECTIAASLLSASGAASAESVP
jgi:hypothetical protein